MDGYRIAYKPLGDSTLEAEAEVLATVYRFLLDRCERRDEVAADGAEERDEHAE